MATKSSVLKVIMEAIYETTSYEHAMGILKTRLDDPSCSILGSDKRKIMMKALQCDPSLTKLQQYLTNSWLFFEGMSVK